MCESCLFLFLLGLGGGGRGEGVVFVEGKADVRRVM